MRFLIARLFHNVVNRIQVANIDGNAPRVAVGDAHLPKIRPHKSERQEAAVWASSRNGQKWVIFVC
jgi:hypothetical protein